MIMSAKHVETVVESGTESFIPLNKLKKSPKNARKTPVCTENLIRVADVMESPKLAE
jgi:hypothetical protein